jgi:hypothetical protein
MIIIDFIVNLLEPLARLALASALVAFALSARKRGGHR